MRITSPIGQKSNRWYRIALRVITREIDAGRAAGETVEKIRSRVDHAYPFGERKYWPYKEWLACRREVFFRLGLRMAKEREREAQVLRNCPLFSGGEP